MGNSSPKPAAPSVRPPGGGLPIPPAPDVVSSQESGAPGPQSPPPTARPPSENATVAPTTKWPTSPELNEIRVLLRSILVEMPRAISMYDHYLNVLFFGGFTLRDFEFQSLEVLIDKAEENGG